MTISLSGLRRAIHGLDGQRIETQHRRLGFVVRLTHAGVEYIPESSGQARPDSWNSIQRVLDRFNELGSFSPKDYHDLTHHSSYLLTILRRIVGSEQHPTAAVEHEAGRTDSQPKTARNNVIDAPKDQDLETTEAAPSGPSRPHQRVGSVSNAHVGADFERVAQEYFAKQGINLSRSFGVEIGLLTKKVHYFDLGAAKDKILVECKSHRWTVGRRVPSAKMTVWNEAMYYFFLAPEEYRKVLFVLHHKRDEAGESLLSYYKRMHAHMIPANVEFLEWDEDTGDIVRV